MLDGDWNDGRTGSDWSATVPVAALSLVRAAASEDACAPVATAPTTDFILEFETCRARTPPAPLKFSGTRSSPQSTLR